MFKLKPLLLLSMQFFVASNAFCQEEVFSYTSNGSFSIDINLGEFTFHPSNSDHMQSVEVCSFGALCLITPQFTITVPEELKPNQRWKYGDLFHASGGMEERMVFGSVFKGIPIVQNTDSNFEVLEGEVSYFFSEQRGIVVIEIVTGLVKQSYILKGTCGLGAPRTCN